MQVKVLFRSVATLLCVCLLLEPIPAHANIGYASDSKAAAVIGGLVAAGAAIGLGIYFLTRKSPTLTGCVKSSGGLTLENESDHRRYTLIGDTAQIRDGDRVRVAGKRKKGEAPSFVVEKVAKDYGPCKAGNGISG